MYKTVVYSSWQLFEVKAIAFRWLMDIWFIEKAGFDWVSGCGGGREQSDWDGLNILGEE